MFFMTQNRKALINGEFVSAFYIEESDKIEAADKNKYRLMADGPDGAILLGYYEKAEHATTALKFIGCCLVDDDAKAKITQIPTNEDLALKDKFTGDKSFMAGLEKLKEAIMSSGITGEGTITVEASSHEDFLEKLFGK